MRPPAKRGKKSQLTEKKGKRPSLKKKTKYLFGYDAAFAVTRDAHYDEVLLDDNTPNPDILPALVLGVSLDKPGHRPAYNGLKVLSRLRERGYTPGFLAGDLAYNNSEPDEWQLPIRALGYKPVYDYRVDQLGKQAETQGAILVEGTWYCPSMPQPVIDATKDLCAERIDRETWTCLIKSRKSYRLMPKENEDPEGHQRMMCPAEAGKAQCPIKPRSMGREAATSASRSSTPSQAPPDRSRSAASAASLLPPKQTPSTGRPSSTATTNGRRSTSASATGSRATTATRRTPLPKQSKRPAPGASAASLPRLSF